GLGHRRGDGVGGKDRGDLPTDQIGRQRRQPIDLAFRPAEFNRDVAALDEPHLAQALAECRNTVGVSSRRRAVEKPAHWHRPLLRGRQDRPRHSAAEKGDKVAAFHSITSSARPRSVSGTSIPSALAVLRLITSSYLVGACTGRSAGFSPLRMRSTYPAAPRYRPTRSG